MQPERDSHTQNLPPAQPLTRRRFLAASAAACAAPCILPARVLGRDGATAPSERVTVGVIGLGGRGSDQVRTLLGDNAAQLLAVCDVFASKAEGTRKKVEAHYGAQKTGGPSKGCAAYQDFRELLARADIDAVFVDSTENWHALHAILAMQAGKDVYCEKALARTVVECRAVCDTVRRTGRVFQAGTQQRSAQNFRFACELARNGCLGKLHTVTVGAAGGKKLPLLQPEPVPPDLDYELWLGPAPFKPYRKVLCDHEWHYVSDYDAGYIATWGVHHVDIACWGAPSLHEKTVTVEGAADFPDAGTADNSISWKVKLTTLEGLVFWHCSSDKSPYGFGIRFEGDKGWVHVDRGVLKAEPAALLDTIIRPNEEHLYKSSNHQTNFLECVRSRREPASPVESVHIATVIPLIADMATRLGRKLVWDWQKERFLNDDTANLMLSRALRAPWHI
ncbi:MAG: Gfo/Idh/MocA family oxidoreductase [Planctomycetota bacterium]